MVGTNLLQYDMSSLAEKSIVSPQTKANENPRQGVENGKDDNDQDAFEIEEESLHFTMLDMPNNTNKRSSKIRANGLDASDRSTTRIPNKSLDQSERSNSPTKNNKRGSSVSNDLDASVNHIFATKENSAMKWQRARCVVGALEVHSEPFLRFREDLIPHAVKGQDVAFQEALQAWEDLKLRNDFIKACEKLPAEECCCGFMNDHDATKRRFVKLLNEEWCKQVNKKLLKNNRGVKVDVFLWHWQNASGKSETNIIMIRFFELSTNRFRRASKDGSLDLPLFELEDVMNDGPEMTAPERAEILR